MTTRDQLDTEKALQIELGHLRGLYTAYYDAKTALNKAFTLTVPEEPDMGLACMVERRIATLKIHETQTALEDAIDTFVKAHPDFDPNALRAFTFSDPNQPVF